MQITNEDECCFRGGKKCKQKAKALNLNKTDLVLDHAIYSKAVEIVTNAKYADLRTFINIQMGGFHAASIFLGVIGKRFKYASLKRPHHRVAAPERGSSRSDVGKEGV